MKQLDIIHLRLTRDVREDLIESIRESIRSESLKGTLRFYSNAKLSTDLSIHIHLETDSPTCQCSELGTRLAAALQEYGMVKHTLWIEDEQQTESLSDKT